jgi:hypothetical protein
MQTKLISMKKEHKVGEPRKGLLGNWVHDLLICLMAQVGEPRKGLLGNWVHDLLFCLTSCCAASSKFPHH